MTENEYIKKIKRAKEELILNDSLVNYLKLYKGLQDINLNVEEKKIKIAVIGDSTLDGVKEVLNVKCRILGLYPLFYIAPYGQYAQVILNENSALYEFKPDITIVWINVDTVFSENFYLPYRLSSKNRKKLVEDCFKNITLLLKKISEGTDSKVILHNFQMPISSSMGILENKQEYGLVESINNLNNKLIKNYQTDNQVFIFDFEGFTSRYGKENVTDLKLRFSADMRLKPDFIPKLCDEYLGYIKPIKSLNKKCLVLDLDNTLWGGVVGEDGFEGIKLGPKSPGNAFVEFQKVILSLYERGIILAINSKNNPDDALKVIKEHPYMVLKEKHFAAIKINWNDKASNMAEIANELNINLDSLVFIDDDRTNRALVREMLPQVLTLEIPDDPALYAQTLQKLNDFNILQLTEEDIKRGEMYAQQRKRTEFQKISLDLKDFLKNLNLKVTLSKADKFNIPRISQLTQKTNQFNMTTKRYLEEDITKFSENKNSLIFSAQVEDRFGDYGLTGAVIIRKDKETWVIDTFLLSCRVLGKEVEKAILAFVIEQARKDGVKRLVGEFISTKKNTPAKDFYKDNKFKLANKVNEKEEWVFNMDTKHDYPDYIKINLRV